jgi:hypothetical protein
MFFSNADGKDFDAENYATLKCILKRFSRKAKEVNLASVS